MLTPARAGLARSGVTRANYPITFGAMVPLYAISNIARSGATRSNYTGSHVYIDIGGVPADDRVMWAGASLSDTLDETPTTGTISTFQFHPVEGQEVLIRLGSRNNSRRLFAGTILAITRRYEGKRPANAFDDCRLIDYTWGLGARQVRTRYVNTMVAAIVANLVATYAPGYTWHVETDIGAVVVDEITFTETSLPGCLTQLTRRVGGSWQCDYQKTVQVFFENTLATNPRPLNAVHPTLMQFTSTRDLSQIVTRVLVEGGGVNAFANCAVGESILPVDGDPGWYPTSGGTVVCGPQRITYTGVSTSTGGGMVGPGAAPSGAPVAALASGAGVPTGPHSYAVTFTTASGESLVGPTVPITVGFVAAPASAPTAGTATAGAGPEAGAHWYAVTFTTASGETTAGPGLETATGNAPPPGTAPTPTGLVYGLGGPEVGYHEYAATFTTATGETTAGPIGPGISVPGAGVANPTVAPRVPAPVANGGPARGSFSPIGEVQRYLYAYSTNASYLDHSAVTASSPASPPITCISNNDPLNPNQSAPVFIFVPFSQDPRVQVIKLYQEGSSVTPKQFRLAYQTDNQPASAPGTEYRFSTEGGSTSNDPNLGPPTNTIPIISQSFVQLETIPTGPSGTTARKLYRRSAGAGLRLLTTIANNSATTYTDSTPNASLGAVPPATNTASLNVIHLKEIPTGGALVTGRKVYRSAVNTAAPLKLVATLADNMSTTYTDTTPDASLGATAPASNTATANQVDLTAIPTGAAAVTSRKIYRTAAYQTTPLKLLATLADNTTRTYHDAIADGSLGAAPPVVDTSGLTQPSGAVFPGSTTIQIASIGPFPPAGWAVIGNGQQVIRYTGVSGSSLIGIPASGPGSIEAAISYNSTVTAAPVLTGIPASGAGSIRFPILRGDEVNLLITVDDPEAQAALAALIGGDGIHESYIQDRRLSSREATARGRAALELKRDVGVELRFQTRDINTRAGATIAVNLGAPFFVIGDFLVQDVTIEFIPSHTLTPVFTATASSYRLSFEDLLRAIKAKD